MIEAVLSALLAVLLLSLVFLNTYGLVKRIPPFYIESASVWNSVNGLIFRVLALILGLALLASNYNFTNEGWSFQTAFPENSKPFLLMVALLVIAIASLPSRNCKKKSETPLS